MTETKLRLPRRVKAPLKKAAAPPRRQSSRLAAKARTQPASESKAPSRKATTTAAPQEQLARGFMEKLDAISRKLSQLALHKAEDEIIKAGVLTPIVSGQNKDLTDVTSSVDSDRTLAEPLYQVVEPQEKDMCTKLFSPLESIPDRRKLQAVLLQPPQVKIPIHHSTYGWLKTHVEDERLQDIFDIVEVVGNLCPKLTPRVETALQVKVATDVTEGMQQCFLDTFLLGVIGTAQEYLELDAKVDRNANELSMTQTKSRPDYLLMLNGLLVFKGEEKKAGDVRHIALELIDKMIPGSVGKDGKLDYLLGYATAGSRVLFECIHGDGKMSECSDILNLERVADRVTLIVILLNVVRVACALYNAKY